MTPPPGFKRITPLILFACTSAASAADYQFISTSTGTIYWENQTASSWNSASPWAGTPPVGGPTGSDNLDLAAAAGNPGLYLNNGGTVDTVPQFKDYFIDTLSTSAVGQRIRGYSATRANFFVNSIEVTGTGAALTLSRNQSNAVINVAVQNVLVGEGATLNIGAPDITTSGGTISQFLVSGTTTVNGTLLHNRLSAGASTVNFGDLLFGASGLLSLSSFDNAATSSGSPTVNARSIAGSGAIVGSNIAGDGVRNPILRLYTEADADAVFSGVLSNSSVVTTGTSTLRLTVEGSGRQTLTGTNTYTNTTTLNGGALILADGGSINSTSSIAIAGGGLIQNSSVDLTAPITWTGGLIGGNGTIIGNITASGTALDKFLSPGDVNAGILSVVGNVTMNSATTFMVALNGSAPGIGYDVLDLSGTLTLGNAALAVSLGYSPALNQVYTIAEFGSLAGTFDGLNDGDSFFVGGYEFMLNYNSDDITLTLTAIPEPGVVALFSGILVAFVTILIRRRMR